MDLEDFIISNAKKKKKSYVDQVLDGTHKIKWENSEDIAPVKKKKVKSTSIQNKDVEKTVNKMQGKTWYQQILQKPEAFNDGYQIGDITKTVGGTVADLGTGLLKGAAGLGESFGELAAGGIAQVADWIGQDDYANKVRKNIAEEKGKIITKKIDNVQNTTLNPYSVLGNTTDAGAEGIGQALALGGIGKAAGAVAKGINGAANATKVAQTATGVATFMSGAGSTLSESYQNEDVKDWQVWTKAIGSGLLAKKIEELGGLFSTKGTDKAITNAITDRMKSSFAKVATRALGTGIAEGGEEGLEYIAEQVLDRGIDIATHLTKTNDVKYAKDWDWDEFWTSMFAGAMAGTSIGSVQTASEVASIKNPNMTWGEAINETAKQQDIREMSELKEIQSENVQDDLEDLNERLKKETDPNQIQELQEEIRWKEKQQNALQDIAPINTEAQKQGLEQAIVSKQEELKQSQDAREQQIIQEEIDQLNQELNEITNAQQITDGKQQRFVYEPQENDSDIKKAVYESAYVFDNTEKSHKFVDAVAKIAEERGTVYKFTNNEQLQQQGYAKEGLTVNGLVNENGEVLINIDSAKSLNKVLGHETTHLLEGTQEYQDLKKMAIQYAKTTGEYDSRLENLTKLYEGTNADIEAELTSDIVGDYLFTNEQFVQELSVQKPTLFQKIKALIDDLIVKFTGTEQEKQLRKLQKSFDKAYKNTSNQSNTDTKYSVSDNQGRTLTKEQQEYFKDSKVRDENGNLIKVYHGTNKAGFTEFKRNVNFFTDNKEVAQTYTGNDGIYEGYVNITNPTTIDANGEIWSKIDVDNISIDGINNIRDFLNTYGASTWKEGGKLRTSTADLVSAIEDAIDEGEIVSDGVIIKNIYDEGSYSSSVGEKLGTDYITFNSNQFKNTDNTKPTTNPDIRYSLSESGKMVDNKGNEVKLEASETGTHGTLMAIHNLSESKLNGILELGGFPVPSIAITDTNKNNHTQFGNISVIFDKSTINPSNYENEVYDRDVWSPTFPSVEYDVNNADIKKYITKNLEYDYKDDIISQTVTSYLYESNLNDKVNRYGIEGALKSIKEDPGMKYLYKTSVEKDSNYKPEMKEKRFSNYYENKTLKRFIDNFHKSHDMSIQDFFYHYINYGDMKLSESERTKLDNQIIDAIKPEIEEYWNKFKDRLTEEQYKKAVQEEINSAIDTYGKWYDFLMNASSYSKNGEYQTIDRDATLKEIDNNINQSEYEKWVDSTFGEMFKNLNKGIRNNKDPYTSSGNRRSFNQLHDDYNLSNIVRALTSKDTKGGEGGFTSGSFGEIQAKMANRFNSIEDIKNASDRLMSSEEANELLEPLKEKIQNNIQELSEYYHSKGYYSNNFEMAAEAISEFAGKNKQTVANFKKVLNSFYNFDIDSIPESLYSSIINNLNSLKNIQTDYFEAKPQRAVGLNEVQAVVVPNNISTDLKQQLYDRGLNIIEYDPNIEGDRQAKINELDEFKFSLSAQNEEIAPTGDWNIYGKDIKFQEQVKEAIAPLKETIENLTEQIKTIQENIAPVQQEPVSEPKTYYHGTRGDFDAFDNNKIGQNYEGDWSSLGRGFYFTHDYDSAKEFGEASTNEGEVNVKEAQLDIKNPFYVDDITKADKNILTDLQTKYELDEGSLANGYTLIDALKKKGLDSTDVLKQYGYDGIVAEDEVMVFDASQIKTKDTKTLQVDKSIALTKKVAQNGNTQQLTPISELEEIKQEALQEESPEKLSQLLSRAEQLEGKESSFYENITETSKAYDETARNMFKDESDIKYYQGITNEQSLSEAKTRLDRGGNQEALRWINQDVKEATATDVAEGWILLKQYQDAQDYDSMVQIAKKMREIGTTSGQTVQAFNILSRLTPEGMVKYAVSELNEIKTKLTENKPKQWIDDNAEAFELTPNETAFIVNNMKEIQRMKEDGYIQNRVNELNAQKENLTNKKEIKKIDKDIKLLENGNLEYAEKVKLAEIQAMLEDKLPPSLGQSINAWMRVSMLFNPKTQVRNVLGNAGIAPVNMVSDVISTALDKAISKQTKIRTKGLTDLKSYGLGFGKGLYESYSDFKRGINTRDVSGNRFEVKRGKSFTEKTIIGKTVNRIDNLNSFLLDAGDRGFYEAAFVNSINNQKVLNNTDTVTQDMINIATNEALERTWQDNNNYTQFVLNIRKGLNKVGFKDFGLGDVLIPFAKTPANLTKAIIDYSPAGVVNAIKSGRNLKNSLKNGQFDPQMQHKFVSDVGKATAGTMLYILGYALATAGITSGEDDEDKDVRNFLKNTLGINSYSIDIGGHSFTYDWAQPLAAPLSIMANIVQGQEEEKELGELILSSLDTAGNLILEQSFMESINTVLSNNEGIATGLQEAIFGLPSRAIPTFSKQIADMTDGTTRQSFVAGKPLESAINQVKNKIPGLSTTLAPSVDTLGNEIQKYGGENTIYNVFFNPSTVNANKIKEEGAEIYRVYEATGDKTVMPRVAPYSIKTKDVSMQLDGKQRAEFQKISGDIVKNNVSNLLENSDYKAMDDIEKAEVLKNIVNYAYNKAQSEVAGTELSDSYKAVVSFENIGGNASDYYTIKGQISEYDADYESSKEELSAKHSENSDTYEEKVGELSATKKKNVANTILNTNLTDQQKAFMYGKEYSSEETINKILDTADSFDNFLRYETSTASIDKDDDKKEFLQKADYSDNDKVAIYENVICSDFDNEEKYKGYKTSKAAQIDINSWLALDSQGFKADKDSSGKPISGSKKNKVIKYVNSLELTIPEKAILIKASSNFKFNDYNNDIISYLNGLDLEYDEKVNILEELDMTVKSNGSVYWK